MPPSRRGKRSRVVLCAALTVDGKLDVAGTAVTPAHFPWVARVGAQRTFCTDAAAFRAMFDEGIVAEIWLAVRPRVDGRRDAPTLSGPPGAEWFPASLACRLLRMEMRDGECLLRYRTACGGMTNDEG